MLFLPYFASVILAKPKNVINFLGFNKIFIRFLLNPFHFYITMCKLIKYWVKYNGINEK